MKTVVLKFGGTSVGTVDRIKKVANIIISYVKKRYKVIYYYPLKKTLLFYLLKKENILNLIKN